MFSERFNVTFVGHGKYRVRIIFDIRGSSFSIGMSTEHFKKLLKAMLRFDERLSNG